MPGLVVRAPITSPTGSSVRCWLNKWLCFRSVVVASAWPIACVWIALTVSGVSVDRASSASAAAVRRGSAPSYVSVIAGSARPVASRAPFAVGLRVVRLIDSTRSIRLPNGRTEPRRLVTYVRYPALGRSPSGADLAGASPARTAGPFPLVVFGHGYAVTPSIYADLLRAWTRAGYVCLLYTSDAADE